MDKNDQKLNFGEDGHSVEPHSNLEQGNGANGLGIPDKERLEVDFSDFELEGEKLESLKRRQRAVLLDHLSKMQAQKTTVFHQRMRLAAKTTVQAFFLFSLINVGVLGWYWFEFDFNIYNPKLTRYVTHRFG